jgi:hypothetical protein
MHLGNCLRSMSFCPIHSQIQKKKENKEEIKLLRLGIWEDRVNEIKNHPDIRTLKAEIGILRMTLENIVTTCGDAHSLIINSGKISDLVLKIEKLVKTCCDLESKSSLVLTKDQVSVMMNSILGVICENVKDPQTIEDIAKGMECLSNL